MLFIIDVLCKKKIVILGGGTFSYVRNHLALAAPAFGTTAKALQQLLPNSQLILTRMADSSSKIETNQDVSNLLKEILKNREVVAIVMNIAMCDYDGQIADLPSGKYAKRLSSRAGLQNMELTPSEKVIKGIKQQRPDLILVGFKTTVNDSTDEQTAKAQRMLKESNCDLVLANDVGSRQNLLFIGNKCISSTSNRNLIIKQLAKELKTLVEEQP